jgi:hypothetical protein
MEAAPAILAVAVPAAAHLPNSSPPQRPPNVPDAIDTISFRVVEDSEGAPRPVVAGGAAVGGAFGLIFGPVGAVVGGLLGATTARDASPDGHIEYEL